MVLKLSIRFKQIHVQYILMNDSQIINNSFAISTSQTNEMPFKITSLISSEITYENLVTLWSLRFSTVCRQRQIDLDS